jgi:peptide deformylase
MQHELDHLDGKLYIDYLDSMDDLISTEHDDEDEDEDFTTAKRAAVG